VPQHQADYAVDKALNQQQHCQALCRQAELLSEAAATASKAFVPPQMPMLKIRSHTATR
jgi:hypothetical protein